MARHCCSCRRQCAGRRRLGSSDQHAPRGSFHGVTILRIVEKLSQSILYYVLQIALLSLNNINGRIPNRIVQWCCRRSTIVGVPEQSSHDRGQGLDHGLGRNEITRDLGQLWVTERRGIIGNVVVLHSSHNSLSPLPIVVTTPIGIFRPHEIIVPLPLQ